MFKLTIIALTSGHHWLKIFEQKKRKVLWFHTETKHPLRDTNMSWERERYFRSQLVTVQWCFHVARATVSHFLSHLPLTFALSGPVFSLRHGSKVSIHNSSGQWSVGKSESEKYTRGSVFVCVSVGVF